MEEIWIGIDLGTQSVRALAVTASGRVVGRGDHPLASDRSAGRHEQDPRAWWTAVTSALRATVKQSERSAVRAVAICSTSGTFLLTDATGEPLTGALMYDDGRAEAEAHHVREVGAATWQRLGVRIQTSWALPKLVWLARTQPALLPRARLCHQADFIAGRLVGEPVATDTSHALKSGYDLEAGAWPTEVLDALGLPPSLMPSAVPPGSVLGAVGSAAAAETGLPAGTPVVAGMTDGCASQIGAGALEAGSWNSVLGTTLVLKGVTKRRLEDPSGVVYSHRAPGGEWLPGGASSVGAGALSARFPGADLAALDRAAAAREPASVIAYPLVSRGERFPFTAPGAEGFILGQPQDDADLFAALLQGVAFVEKLCFRVVERLGASTDGAITLTGGATRSRYWCQLRADVLGRAVRLPELADPALGMAILAAAQRRHRVAEVASKMVRIRDVMDPRADRTERFFEPYSKMVGELERRGWLPS